MKKLISPLLLALAIFSTSFIEADTKIAGVTFASTYKVDNAVLQLNGAGLRSKWFLDLYTVGLYIPTKSKIPTNIIDCDCIQGFRIVITSSLVTTEKFNSAIDEAINKSMNNNSSSIEKELIQFKKALGTDLKIYDEFMLIYKPNEGLQVYKNNKFSDTIKEIKFKKEMMRIWIGENCINKDLKHKLLGIEN